MPEKFISLDEKKIVELYEKGIACYKKDKVKNSDLVNYLREVITVEGMDEGIYKAELSLSTFVMIPKTLSLLVGNPLAYLIVRIQRESVTLKFQLDLNLVDNSTRYRLNNTYNLNIPMLKSEKYDVDF